MKFNVPIGEMTVELECETQKELFKELAKLDAYREVLEEPCGKCGSTNLRRNVRTAGQKDEYEYLELCCNKCRAKLPISEHNNKQGTLYPNRVENDTKGWVKWNPETKQEE